jgi:hypothetical protein
VLCLIIVPLPPGKKPFAVQLNNNKSQCIKGTMQGFLAISNILVISCSMYSYINMIRKVQQIHYLSTVYFNKCPNSELLLSVAKH